MGQIKIQKFETKVHLDQANKNNARTMGKRVTLEGNEDDSANVVTEEVQDALLLAVDSPLDD